MKDEFVSSTGIFGQRHYRYLRENKPNTINVMSERMELKSKISMLCQKITESEQYEKDRSNFTEAIKLFMKMDRLTAPLLRELIDHTDVYETEGTGKSRTQRIIIYYRFVGYVEKPDTAFKTHVRADTRKGVSVEYLTEPIGA